MARLVVDILGDHPSWGGGGGAPGEVYRSPAAA